MSNAVNLLPLASPLGVNPAFISNQQVTLVMKENFSFGGESFVVKTVEGHDVVRCEGKVMSFSDRKQFTSPTGEHLFTLRKEQFSIPKSWYLEGPGGEKFVTIDGRFSFGGAKMDVIFKNNVGDGRDVKLEVRGSFFDRSCDITWNGVPVAVVSRSFMNFRQVFGDRHTYGVALAPGVDAALMAACCVAMDEQRKQRK